MICSIVEGKDKFLSLKLDILQKHVSWKKIVSASIGMNVGDWYFNKDSTHATNERLYLNENCAIYNNFPASKPWLSNVWILSS